MSIFTKISTTVKSSISTMTKPKPITMRFFEVEVISVTPLSPSFMRIGFKGGKVPDMCMFAPDQWIKLYIPNPDGSVLRIHNQAHYNKLPKATRPPVRTYTISALRPDQYEFDVDFVLHGDEGPASRWAMNAKIGDQMQIRAHCYSEDDTPSGCRWLPPKSANKFLLFADETGLPATIGILNLLAQQNEKPNVEVFVETPTLQDRLAMPEWEGLTVKYLIKSAGQTPGQLLYDEAVSLAPAKLEGGVYIWLAAEKTATRRIRLHLSKVSGLGKDAISVAGYWKYGEKQY